MHAMHVWPVVRGALRRARQQGGSGGGGNAGRPGQRELLLPGRNE
jgi:hypothetical protein